MYDPLKASMCAWGADLRPLAADVLDGLDFVRDLVVDLSLPHTPKVFNKHSHSKTDGGVSRRRVSIESVF
jgi:hypothetical protein